MDKEIISYHEVMAALNRILEEQKYKSQKSKTTSTKRFAQGRVVLYESIIHYLNIHAKRHL